MNKILRTLTIVAFASALSTAESSANNTNKSAYLFPQNVTPQLIDSYSSGGYFNNGKAIYNVKQGVLCEMKGDIKTFAVSPNGKNIAIIFAGKGGNELYVNDLWERGRKLFKPGESLRPTAVCYTWDGKLMAVADQNTNVYMFDNKSFKLRNTISVGSKATFIAISADSKHLAVAYDNNVKIFDINNNKQLDKLTLKGKVTSIQFTEKSASLTILTDDSVFSTYDPLTSNITKSVEALGAATDCDLHVDEKYLATVVSDSRISVINMHNTDDRQDYNNNEGGISNVKFIKDSKGINFLMYNTAKSIVYQPLHDLLPNYTLLLHEELDTRMEAWAQRMEGETLEEYQFRVSDEGITAQRKLFEEEISTELAADLITSSEITLGNFNMDTNTLAVNVSTMPTFYLNVPTEDVGMFTDTSNLEFSNAVYGLNENDEFELLYIDVYNKKTGETYNFNNKERKSLKYMENEAGFVPVDVVLIHNEEVLKLEEIKQEVVAEAMNKNVITNNTNIQVDANVETRKDEAGNKIIDYNIGFQYDVAAEYSAQEDFTPGEYHTERSGAAKSMCQIIKTAFENEFAQYIKPGAKLQVSITGMADRLKILKGIPYDGCYGDFVAQPIGNLNQNVTVTKSSGITDNNQLALLRAAGLKEYINKDLTTIQQMDAEYIYNIKIAEQAGGEYRRITIEFKFLNVF